MEWESSKQSADLFFFFRNWVASQEFGWWSWKPPPPPFASPLPSLPFFPALSPSLSSPRTSSSPVRLPPVAATDIHPSLIASLLQNITPKFAKILIFLSEEINPEAEMADFQTSTHRSKWIFTLEDLMERRTSANDAAVKMLEQYGTTRVDVNVDGSISYPEPTFDLNSTVEQNTNIKPLSYEEEEYMRIFYEQKIQEVCKAFQFPIKIQATSLIYFKRFYLQWSVMQHHPKNIMLTCIYASCKIEENHVSAEELGKGIKQDPKPILNNEMLVLQSLGFDLIVYAPYRPISGFIQDLEESGLIRNGELEHLQGFHDTAILEANRIMLTDAPLLYPPGQLALAAMRRSNEVHHIIDFERYMDTILSRQNSPYSVSELLDLLRSIDYLVDKLKVPTIEDMKPIDRKLRMCLDPSSQDESKKREKKSRKSKRTT